MKRLNRLIVLIDFSEHSNRLVDFAYRFADQFNARMLFVHQVPGFVPSMADPKSKNEIISIEIADAQNQLRTLTKDRNISDDAFHISPKPILITLQELKTDYFHDWVLSGLKSSGVLKRIFIGSTTLSIVNESDALTLAIPLNNTVVTPQKLVVAVNEKYPLNALQFEHLLSVMLPYLSGLEFITVLSEDDNETAAHKYLRGLQERYAAYPTEVFLSKGENKFEALKQHLQQNTVSTFLVLQQGSRSLQDQIFRKFMINELVYSGISPLIVLSK
jgi:hypothetical protein